MSLLWRRVGWFMLAAGWCFVAVSLLGFHAGDPPAVNVFPTNNPVANWGGKFGAVTSYYIFQMFGHGAWVLLALSAVMLWFIAASKPVGHVVVRTIGALILTGLLASAQPNVGANFPLQVIAAAVVGGVSVSGGRGTVGMAIIGILLIGVVSNGFNLMGLDSNFQNVFTGVILIVAVAVDSYLRKRSLRVAVRRLRTRRGLEPDPANLPATASD